ncbi:NTP transferase domain-containing protein [Bacillus sp. BGMRC 2118]|nr:NTP transferase domain-containing protein [Bacillus sp. BGMRC 2118]
MNVEALKIVRELKKEDKVTQRELSKILNISLGKTNKLFSSLMDEGYITHTQNGYSLTDKAENLLKPYKVDNAIIMAAGFGSRFVPITFETPKGLLEVLGERMIERQIEQLLEVGIKDITLVVGYLKEKFEYLIDKYGVKLVYNPDYATKNNISTIYHVRDLLKNTYILCSDNYMTENIFNAYEFESWYSAVKSDGPTAEWCITTDKKNRITKVEIGGTDTWHMYGPVFYSKEFSEKLIPLIVDTYGLPGADQFYWEDVYKNNLDQLDMYMNPQDRNVVYEFENLEELRAFDPSYREHSKNQILSLISSIFHVKESEITDIKPLKLGMTNKSFVFSIHDKAYICRIPGEGTDRLINRDEEFQSIQAVIPLGITENIVYIDPKSGVKISEFEQGARSVDVQNDGELIESMKILRKLHQSNIVVPHSFNIEKNILVYEGLCKASDAILFEDYSNVRTKMSELLSILKDMDIPSVFSHIDPNHDNFLVLPNGQFKLIDWEYAAMSDPVIDLSMFAIYSYMDQQQVENLMGYYFEENPTHEERIRVYAYMALGGFLWTLWAQYKQALGETFGEYTLTMYRYAKDYYKKTTELLKEKRVNEFTTS